jgi:hypothetical protein
LFAGIRLSAGFGAAVRTVPAHARDFAAGSNTFFGAAVALCGVVAVIYLTGNQLRLDWPGKNLCGATFEPFGKIWAAPGRSCSVSTKMKGTTMQRILIAMGLAAGLSVPAVAEESCESQVNALLEHVRASKQLSDSEKNAFVDTLNTALQQETDEGTEACLATVEGVKVDLDIDE